MAGQINAGRIRVENGSASVLHVWQVTLESVTGTFDPGDALSWPGASTGVVVSWDAIGKALRFYRTAGTAGVVVANTVTNTTQSGSGDIAARVEPPGFDTLIAAVPGGVPLKLIAATFPLYDVSTSGADEESFQVTANWNEATATDIRYGIQTEWTETNHPSLVLGDFNAPAIVSQGFAESTRRLRWSGARVNLASDYNAGAGPIADEVIPFDTDAEDSGDGWITTAGGGEKSFTVPSGVARCDVALGVWTDISDANTDMLYAKIVKTGVSGPHPKAWANRLEVVWLDVPVVAGDTLIPHWWTLSVQNPAQILANLGSYFAVRATSFT